MKCTGFLYKATNDYYPDIASNNTECTITKCVF